jgi:hypothetical protein
MAANRTKYLASLIPFIVCTGLSLVLSLKARKDFPDPSYPFQTEEALHYLSDGWFLIGAVLSGVLFSIMLIEDVFSYFEKLCEKKRTRK